MVLTGLSCTASVSKEEPHPVESAKGQAGKIIHQERAKDVDL